MKVTSRISRDSIKIYFDGILHLHFLRDKFLCMQSWYYSCEQMFYIQIDLVGETITCEYDNKELWVDILKELDKAR